jgi:hypothetical protein
MESTLKNKSTGTYNKWSKQQGVYFWGKQQELYTHINSSRTPQRDIQMRTEQREHFTITAGHSIEIHRGGQNRENIYR